MIVFIFQLLLVGALIFVFTGLLVFFKALARVLSLGNLLRTSVGAGVKKWRKETPRGNYGDGSIIDAEYRVLKDGEKQ